MYEINICHLYPDLMNLCGDRGSIIALTRRCEWRGIQVRVKSVSSMIPSNEDYDILFIGGQNLDQSIIHDDLKRARKGHKEAVEANKVILAVCGGLQLLGRYCRTQDGRDLECIGAWIFGPMKVTTDSWEI